MIKKESINFRSGEEDDLWTYIREWEIWLRRRYCMEEGFALPEIPQRPKSAQILYRDSCIKKAHDEDQKFQRKNFPKWDDIEDEKAVIFEKMEENEKRAHEIIEKLDKVYDEDV